MKCTISQRVLHDADHELCLLVLQNEQKLWIAFIFARKVTRSDELRRRLAIDMAIHNENARDRDRERF